MVSRASIHTRLGCGGRCFGCSKKMMKGNIFIDVQTFGELFMNHTETADKRPVSAIIPYALLLCNSLSLLFLNVS